jgi:AcrR family transcriptional regulator
VAYEKDLLEKSILDASEKSLFRFGYKNFNLNDIAKELGISKMTLYKTVVGKSAVAGKVIDRLLTEAESTMSDLIQSELPLPEKLRLGIDIISNIYTKMDRAFLKDLESSLPQLWEKIDAARKERESSLAVLLAKEQSAGTIRADLDPALLSVLILALIRGMYNPAFFLTHRVTSDAVGDLIIDVFLRGVLKK